MTLVIAVFVLVTIEASVDGILDVIRIVVDSTGGN
jgi:hypothetical protein